MGNRQYIAPDGWRLEWDVTNEHGALSCYSHDGIKQWHLSGVITQARIEREIDDLKQEHGLQQSTFWTTYRPREKEEPGPDFRAL